jgi:hypothetical protein
MSINEYCTKLKCLNDQLRAIGHTVSEPSQVLNLLHGLNPRYRHLKPVITSKSPPHTFMSARSFLILEELNEQHDAKAEATQALAARHSSGNDAAGDQHRAANTNDANSSGGDGGSHNRAPRNARGRRRGRGHGSRENRGNSGNGGPCP